MKGRGYYVFIYTKHQFELRHNVDDGCYKKQYFFYDHSLQRDKWGVAWAD